MVVEEKGGVGKAYFSLILQQSRRLDNFFEHRRPFCGFGDQGVELRGGVLGCFEGVDVRL